MKKDNPYKLLLIMAFFHLVIMYIIMYSNVDVFSNLFLNLNKFYMAVMMTLPMIAIEIGLMTSMYKDKKKNYFFIFGAILLLIIFFLFIRTQTGIEDKQFLRSMIPHHSSAILMCEKANIKDQEILDLCDSIIQSQQSEMDQMKKILDRMKS
jgi:hypothetical protein